MAENIKTSKIIEASNEIIRRQNNLIFVLRALETGIPYDIVKLIGEAYITSGVTVKEYLETRIDLGNVKHKNGLLINETNITSPYDINVKSIAKKIGSALFDFKILTDMTETQFSDLKYELACMIITEERDMFWEKFWEGYSERNIEYETEIMGK